MENEHCEWVKKRSYFVDELYKTSCGDKFLCDEGHLKNNGFKYCPYCGKEIKEVIGDEHREDK